MKIVQKVALFAVLLVCGFQMSAKNKDRIFVINNFGNDIVVRGLSTFTLDEKVIKKGSSECIAVSDMVKIVVWDTATKNFVLKASYVVHQAVKTGNVIVVTKKSKNYPHLKVYKNYDAFMAANPDYELDAAATCPNVVPAS